MINGSKMKEGMIQLKRLVKKNGRHLLLYALGLLLASYCLVPSVRAQTVIDKMVASVTNGSRATPDLITYSDLVWQLALEPARPLVDRPSSADLNRALRSL